MNSRRFFFPGAIRVESGNIFYYCREGWGSPVFWFRASTTTLLVTFLVYMVEWMVTDPPVWILGVGFQLTFMMSVAGIYTAQAGYLHTGMWYDPLFNGWLHEMLYGDSDQMAARTHKALKACCEAGAATRDTDSPEFLAAFSDMQNLVQEFRNTRRSSEPAMS